MWLFSFRDPGDSFTVIPGPSDQNDLSHTSLISKIWYLNERKLLGVLLILSIFLLFYRREVLAGVYGLLGPAGCRGMEVLTEQRPAANSPNPPWLYATRTQRANLGFLVEIANLSESVCYQAKSFTIPSLTVCMQLHALCQSILQNRHKAREGVFILNRLLCKKKCSATVNESIGLFGLCQG